MGVFFMTQSVYQNDSINIKLQRVQQRRCHSTFASNFTNC